MSPQLPISRAGVGAQLELEQAAYFSDGTNLYLQ